MATDCIVSVRDTNRNIKRFRCTAETLDFTIRIGSTPTFLYFDLYMKILCIRQGRALQYNDIKARAKHRTIEEFNSDEFNCFNFIQR